MNDVPDWAKDPDAVPKKRAADDRDFEQRAIECTTLVHAAPRLLVAAELVGGLLALLR